MRIAILSTFHERCGIATYTEGLVAGLTQVGIEPTVLGPRLPRGEVPLGEQPQRLWRRNRALPIEAWGVLREIRRIQPALVHAQVNPGLYSTGFLHALARGLRRLQIPLVGTLHARQGGNLGRRFKMVRLLHALRRADLVVHTAAHARELGRERVHLIPCGTPVATPRTLEEARRRLGLELGSPVLVHAGFLTPDKGIAEVLRAVAELRRGPHPDLLYRICGTPTPSRASRACFAELRRLARELGIERQVHLTGEFVSEELLETELQAGTWIVLNYATGSHQGASLAVRCAVASGRPVAVSAAPVFDDVREAVHTLDPGPLAGALARLLADEGLAERTRHAGRRYSAATGWPAIALRHAEVYRAVLGGAGPSPSSISSFTSIRSDSPSAA